MDDVVINDLPVRMQSHKDTSCVEVVCMRYHGVSCAEEAQD